MTTADCNTPLPSAGAKQIVYDPETRDFAMYLDGELTGFARTYQEAETSLDELVYAILEQHADAAPLACADLAALFRSDKAAAAAQLAALTPGQRWLQAVAYASYLSELRGQSFTPESIARNWSKGLSRYTAVQAA